MLLHRVLNSGSGGSPQHFEDGRGGRSKDLDARGGIQGLVVCTSRSLADHSHVELKRVRIWMDLDDSHFGSFVIRILVESDETRLIGLDELNQPRHPLSLSLELSRFQSVGRDEDERPCHQSPRLLYIGKSGSP